MSPTRSSFLSLSWDVGGQFRFSFLGVWSHLLPKQIPFLANRQKRFGGFSPLSTEYGTVFWGGPDPNRVGKVWSKKRLDGVRNFVSGVFPRTAAGRRRGEVVEREGPRSNNFPHHSVTNGPTPPLFFFDSAFHLPHHHLSIPSLHCAAQLARTHLLPIPPFSFFLPTSPGD